MTTVAPEKEPIDPNVIRIATVLIVGGLAVVFDTAIVSVALHTLAAWGSDGLSSFFAGSAWARSRCPSWPLRSSGWTGPTCRTPAS